MKTKKQRLSDRLDENGWEVTKVHENDIEWWGDEIWELNSRRTPHGIQAFITFLIDPQHEGNRRKGESVWALGSSSNFPTTRIEAEENGTISFGTGFNKQINEFLTQLEQMRSNI